MSEIGGFFTSPWWSGFTSLAGLSGLVSLTYSIFRDHRDDRLWLDFDPLVMTSTVGADTFNIRIRNRSIYPVEVEAVGFFFKEKGRWRYRMPPAVQPLPYRIEARSAFSVDLSSGYTLHPDAEKYEGIYAKLATGEIVYRKHPRLRQYFYNVGQRKRDGKDIDGIPPLN